RVGLVIGSFRSGRDVLGALVFEAQFEFAAGCLGGGLEVGRLGGRGDDPLAVVGLDAVGRADRGVEVDVGVAAPFVIAAAGDQDDHDDDRDHHGGGDRVGGDQPVAAGALRRFFGGDPLLAELLAIAVSVPLAHRYGKTIRPGPRGWR